MTTASVEEWRERCANAGQEHLIAAWERLDEAGRARLGAQIAALDFELVRELAELVASPPEHAAAQTLDPPELFPLERTPEQRARAAQATERAAELFSSGQVGYLLVAGGQASRLGYDAPKGMFPVGPVSRKSLFEFHAARLRAAKQRFGTHAPWYVMTSPANDAATKAFFRDKQFFGLDEGEVFFFSQAMNPALDEAGKILLKQADELFLAPNGHGGVLLAMATSGGLADARQRGVTQLSYFQVDNPLVRPADELFVGLHAQAGAGMSSKVVAKRDAHEKVGVLGRMDGTLGCIEYSDLPEELRQATDDDGSLRFRAGNIAVHVIDVDFLSQLTGLTGGSAGSAGKLHLPWHLARKQMQVWHEGAEAQVWGTKFETFVFDALGHSPASITLEVERAHEFSPVKNASGADSPESARRDLCRLFAGWVRKKGHELPEPDEHGVHPVEVSPLVAEHEQSFLEHDQTRPRVTDDGHLYE